ncbi:MAG: alpha/beta fold hydrolase [Actinomycetes bacterium]|jgi:pimeloyl-ACP methyl ester carboxylesterase|nr:alpha/beta fold hydrolase [Acidimicrobiia bacterium]
MLGKLIWKAVKNVPRVATIAAGAGIAWSAVGVDHDMPIEPALPGLKTHHPDGSGGQIALYHDDSGRGEPVLLVHSVNAAASSYEMRPIYVRLQGERPVWALDLPGFGFSDRGDRPYSPRMMGLAIGQALERIGRPTHVVALSLGCEFAARAANDRPDLVRTLSFLSPTGFGGRVNRGPSFGTLLRFPLWSQAAFDGIASRPSIRYYLSKTFVGPVDELYVEYAYRSAHQPGARHAAIAFLAGDLHTSTALDSLYASLSVPTLVVYNTDPFSGFERLPEFLTGRDNWSAVQIPDTNGLPHWDEPNETLEALRRHWDANEG